MDNLTAFTEKIQELSKAEFKAFNGIECTTGNFHSIDPPRADTLVVKTLTGLVDFIEINIDNLEPENLILHVRNFDHVILISKIHNLFKYRENYLTAGFESSVFNYGYYHDLEEFIINVKTKFVNTFRVDNLIKFVGNIKTEAVKKSIDDGVTQHVSASTGITTVSETEVPLYVKLSPFRTFSEIEQPESDFILRVKNGREGIECALFQIENNSWENDAIKKISEYLSDKVGDIKIIA